MIDKSDHLSMRTQCQLLGVPRSRLYYQERPETQYNIGLMNMIDEHFTAHPHTGVEGMVAYLRDKGKTCGPKRIRRLMREMGMMAVYPYPYTSHPNKAHKIYPYLLDGVKLERPNQVWSTDITYIRLRHGFAYLVVCQFQCNNPQKFQLNIPHVVFYPLVCLSYLSLRYL